MLYLTYTEQDQERVFMLGKKLKELRESNGLFQRQVAAILEIDIDYISKMEKNEKPVNRQYLEKLSEKPDKWEEKPLNLWLADKLYDVVRGETVAIKAIEVAHHELFTLSKRTKN